jgi:hypothetical protein
MDKFVYLKNKINEAIEEIASDYETYDEYKKGMSSGRGFFVYSQVDRDSVDNICKNGIDGIKEFMNIMYYGRGMYTTLSYDDCKRYHHGNAMVKYAVKKGAFDNFLIFDIGVKKYLQDAGALTIHEKISDTVKRLFSREDVQMLEGTYGPGLVGLDRQVTSCKNSSQSWGVEEQFLRVARSGEQDIELRKGLRYPSEKRLDMSNVD